MTAVWLTPILSEANHRLTHGEPWADQRLHILRGATGQPVHPLDLSDDRLAAVLEALSQDEPWQAFEGAFTQRWLRGYDLQPERVRLDSTTASGSWRVTEDGLFQFGPSKDHRPDLPQVKVLLAVLAPLGMPVATDIVPGQRADDPLSIPAMARVRESVGRRGLLYVGDWKMGALETRAFLQAGGDAYLWPLAEVQLPPAVRERYLQPGWTGEQLLTRITRMPTAGKRTYIADGDARMERLTTAGAEGALTWTERRLVVRSRQLARAGETALRARLAKARAAVEAIVTRYRGHGLLAVQYTERVRKRPLRRYGSRPATVRVARDLGVQAAVDRPAVATAIERLGWRGYATNAPLDQLSLAQAVLAYRSQDLVERDMGRLKGHPCP